MARRLLFEPENRKRITNSIRNESDRQIAEKVGASLSTILSALSSDKKILVAEYNNICTDLNLLLLNQVSWASIAPSLHKVLAHSWELIEANDETWLKALIKEGFEANNKRLRLYRIKLSRKNNQLNTLTHCFT